MKRVGGNKEHLIWAENNEFYYDEDEVLSSLESHSNLPIAEWYWDFLKKILKEIVHVSYSSKHDKKIF